MTANIVPTIDKFPDLNKIAEEFPDKSLTWLVAEFQIRTQKWQKDTAEKLEERLEKVHGMGMCTGRDFLYSTLKELLESLKP